MEHTKKVLESLYGLAGRYRGCRDEDTWSNVFWACWLHDLGKAIAPFQRCLRRQISRCDHRHEVFSLPFIEIIVQPDDLNYQWIMAAIASHHKHPEKLFERYDLGVMETSDFNALTGFIQPEIVEAYGEWISGTWHEQAKPFLQLGIMIRPPRDRPDTWEFSGGKIQHALETYRKIIRDIKKEAIGSPKVMAGILLRGAMQFSDHLGSFGETGVNTLSLPEPDKLKTRILPPGKDWHSHQKVCGNIRGHVVLAAPTGSGKTEAALLWAQNQINNKQGNGILIYLLPYQASMNAMKSRLEECLATEPALLHGRAMQALFRELTEAGFEPETAEKTAKRINELGRLYQCSIWVASPYQLLRGAYRLPGYEILWTVLSGASIILDEVHAYEPERLGMILELLKELVENWEARALVMTATMPGWLRQLWIEVLQADVVLPARELNEMAPRHKIKTITGDINTTASLEIINRSYRAGKSVLIVVNTIKTAQETWRKMSDIYGIDNVLLIHGRLNSRARLSKEKEILKRTGFDASGGACIVVATQVIEVSLNLDFDTIISEPAPLEALLQRFGRVNRRGKKGTCPVYILTKQTSEYDIYDRRLIEKTIEIITKHDDKPLHEDDVTGWLNWIYDQEGLKEEWLEKVAESRRQFRKLCLDSLYPFNEDKELEKDFESLFDGMDVLPACLVDEFDRLLLISVIEAHSLLVSMDQKRAFSKRCRWDDKRNVWITETEYDPHLGLL
ncbi:MAG: CRISPR-associated helicase Cas3' [Bacillota bacterium]